MALSDREKEELAKLEAYLNSDPEFQESRRQFENTSSESKPKKTAQKPGQDRAADPFESLVRATSLGQSMRKRRAGNARQILLGILILVAGMTALIWGLSFGRMSVGLAISLCGILMMIGGVWLAVAAGSKPSNPGKKNSRSPRKPNDSTGAGPQKRRPDPQAQTSTS